MQKQESVSKVFTRLKNILGSLGFSETFPVFLTDNGSEFSHWIDFLTDEDGLVLSEIFYCDPNAAWQKGRVEKNHEYIRYFIPKGKSFKGMTDEKVLLMVNHINSTIRPKLNRSTPWQFAKLLLPQDLIKELGLKEISAKEINLSPQLIK